MKFPFTDEQLQTALESIRLGATRQRALRAAGIKPKHIQTVQKRADLNQKPARLVLDAIDEAEAEAEVALVKAISASKDGRSKMFLLERRFQDWSARLSLEVTQELQKMLSAAERVLSGGDYERLLKALADKPEDIPKLTLVK